MNALVQCPKCRAPLLGEGFNQKDSSPCPACGTPLQVEVFPAFFRKINPGQGGESIVIEGESSCFYHQQKRAVQPCDSCGRFLCTLCDCELHGQHFCPVCLEAGKTKGKIKSLDNQRTLHDSIALALATFPLLIFYFTIITAPMALIVSIRHWKSPQSILRRTKIRFVIAIILSILQLAGWAVALIVLFTSRNS
jgi:hypothetical protein